MRTLLPLFVSALLSACRASASPAPAGITISDEQASEIGQKIWMNEAGGKVEFLTWWDETPNCPALGINHYIWYPQDRRGPFEETFPNLLRFMAQRKVLLPGWLKNYPPSPWSDRDTFMRDMNTPRMKELRDFLSRPEIVAVQARYSADRLEQALPKMLAEIPDGERESLQKQFYRVANCPNGPYALVDYVNFKGEGVKATERYYDKELGRDQGWGLLQVLQGLETKPSDASKLPCPAALDEYADSAGGVMRRRVKNCPRTPQTQNASLINVANKCAPEHRKELLKCDAEECWLGGWLKRIETYRVKP